jgi:VanZ family protein
VAGRALDIALWVIAISLLAGILLLSLDPEPDLLDPLNLSDAALHLGGYAALTASFLLAGVWRPGRVGVWPRGAPIVALGILAFGVLVEIAQGMVPNRAADWRDAFANTLGVVLAWWTWRAVQRLRLS